LLGGKGLLPNNQTINREQYKTVLGHHLRLFMRICRSKWFLQDGAPCHKSKVVISKLKELEEEFTVIDWPWNSPNPNPIKNCWAYMKAKLKESHGVPSLPRMIKAIKVMWV
jgi:hypothetical protein